MTRNNKNTKLNWYTVDLHVHTPASSDYQQDGVTYLDILRTAEKRGLDAIAFTDHNTVAGYRKMQEEIHQLELLEGLQRLLPEEEEKLREYRRLLKKIVVYPGFEFTATFGFHILGIFSPQKPIREIEHILLNLNIPPDQLDVGSVTVGATADVLTVYREINLAGGLVIAAHANSNHGVAMRGFPIGGQTKIAYTQDPNLHALEVTDLESKGRRSTAAFFNGSKPEYPRRMHCIQGSDAHRLDTDPTRKKVLGIGCRATDIRVRSLDFEELIALFESNDFARTRPHQKDAFSDYDFVRTSLDEGANIVQDFHEDMSRRGGKLYAIIADVCAFANTNGGTLYIGISSNPKRPIKGIENPDKAIQQLEKEVNNRINPPLACTFDKHTINGKNIIRIIVPKGNEPPYAVDDNKIYVRTESETGLAVRDEIVDLVIRGNKLLLQETNEKKNIPVGIQHEKSKGMEIEPRTGVEIVAMEERGGTKYYTVRDLRNGNVVKNVTQKSARKLWHQAIMRYQKLPTDISKAEIHWDGDFGLISRHKRGNIKRYDFALKTKNGYRLFFGVTEDGVHGKWKELIGENDQ